MKRFAETCDQKGYVFAIHDQYRDYYLDAKSYDPRHTILDRNGNRPYGSTWYGGKQSILCSRLALGHVKKNYLSLLSHGVKVRGAYLDVFAVVPPDECYNPEHPVSRRDCLKYRGMCLDFIRAKWRRCQFLKNRLTGPFHISTSFITAPMPWCRIPDAARQWESPSAFQPRLSRCTSAAVVAGKRRVGNS